MKKLAVFSLTLVSLFTFLSSASGELIPYQIKGFITASIDPANINNPFPGVLVGDSWIANFTLDTSVSDLYPQDPSFGSYPMASSFHLTMGLVNRDYSDYLISVIPNFSLSYDTVVVQAPTVISGSPDWVALLLYYVIGTFHDSDSIPPLSNMSGFVPSFDNLAFIQGSTNYITGEVSSITAVPEPATMLLLGSGLGGLALLKRKARMQLSKAGIYYGGIVMRRILIGILLTGIIFVVAPVKADNIAPLPPSLRGLYPTTNTANANIVQFSIGGVGWSDSSTSATLQWFGGIGSAQASVITLGGAVPSVKVSVSAAASASPDSGGDGSYAYATNEYMYYFRVYDPSPVRVYVPVTIDYSIGATKSSSSSDDELTSIYWSVVAQFSPYGYFERPFFRGASWPGDISGNVPEGPNTLNLDYWFLTNTVYPMKLNAYATVKCTASADSETGSDCSVAASRMWTPQSRLPLTGSETTLVPNFRSACMRPIYQDPVRYPNLLPCSFLALG